MTKRIDSFLEAVIYISHVYSDLIFGIMVAVLSLGMYILSTTLKISAQSIVAMDSAQFVPKLTFGALIILGIAIAIQGFTNIPIKKSSTPEGEVLKASVIGVKRALVALISIALFIFLITRISFIIAAILYMIFSMFYMVERRGWKPKRYFIVAFVVSISVYFLFREFIYVRLPLGFLEGVIR